MARTSIMNTLVQASVNKVTQGSADAFAYDTIQTGMSTSSRYGWLIHSIGFMVGNIGAVASADGYFRVQVVKNEETSSLVDSADNDLIYEWGTSVIAAGTPANLFTFGLNHYWEAPPGLLVVNPQLSLLIDSDATGLTMSATARIYYYPTEVSEMDMLRLITSTT